MHFIADFLIKSIIRTRRFNEYPQQFNEYSSNLTITRLFNDYDGTERHNPRKKTRNPAAELPAAGFVYEPEQPKSPISSGFRA